MRSILALSLLLLPMTAALAQEAPTTRPFSPLSGPNTPVDSPICALVNFGFCPQPGEAPPVLPDPEADAAPPARPIPPALPGHHRKHRHVDQRQDG